MTGRELEVGRTWDRVLRTWSLAERVHQRAAALLAENQAVRREVEAIRRLGPRMPHSNSWTVAITWQILAQRGLLTRQERGDEGAVAQGAA